MKLVKLFTPIILFFVYSALAFAQENPEAAQKKTI